METKNKLDLIRNQERKVGGVKMAGVGWIDLSPNTSEMFGPYVTLNYWTEEGKKDFPGIVGRYGFPLNERGTADIDKAFTASEALALVKVRTLEDFLPPEINVEDRGRGEELRKLFEALAKIPITKREN